MFKKIHCFFLIFLLNGAFAQIEQGSIEYEFQEGFGTYESPEIFVESLVDDLFHFVSNREELSTEEQEKTLIQLGRKYFDVERISKSVLGRNFKNFNQDQFEEFTKYFELILAKSLVAFLVRENSFNADDIIIGEFKVTTKTRKGRILHKLSSSVQLSKGATPVSVRLRILEESNNYYKILTVSIESFDYILSQRNVYSSLNLQTPESINKLLSDMKKKSEI